MLGERLNNHPSWMFAKGLEWSTWKCPCKSLTYVPWSLEDKLLVFDSCLHKYDSEMLVVVPQWQDIVILVINKSQFLFGR